ncbi:MAG TPA: hypothetical protein ENG83_12475 [Nitrospirae bacterium]|nr:hypothetical protein BMS3Abin06_02643 [bacterium BMS3Abin06]HDH12992.1 hypothetical protein [Nitrospirota bacterium]HDZ01729.1 hypothetical protein [Nitrospirota bacterium]
MLDYLRGLDATQVNTIVTVVAIFLTIATSTYLLRRLVINVIRSILLRIFSGHIVLKNDYYSHAFVLRMIRKSKKHIRIMCVRNERITEPDIIEAMRKFITEIGTVEILALHPDFSDCVTEECMCVLPAPPKTKEQFKKQVISNHSRVEEFYNDLGQEEKKRYKYYYFNALPLIHMCQFDNIIYIGFQLFHRDQVDNSLLNYSIMVKDKSNLGQQIVKQFEYVRDNKSMNPLKSK